MEKIIITGTNGFVGSNLKKELESKYEILEINEDIFKSINWREEVSKFFWMEIKGVFHIGACSNTLETDVNYIMLVNGTIKLLKEKPLEYSHFSENNMFGLNQLNLDSKGSNNGFDSKDRNIVNQILFPLDKDGKFKAFGKTSKNLRMTKSGLYSSP
jgi:hypothetical protein